MPQLPPKLHKQRLRQLQKQKRRHQARLQEHQKVYRELHRRQDQVLAELRKG